MELTLGKLKKKLWSNVADKEIYLFCLQNKRGTKH